MRMSVIGVLFMEIYSIRTCNFVLAETFAEWKVKSISRRNENNKKFYNFIARTKNTKFSVKSQTRRLYNISFCGIFSVSVCELKS